MNTRDFSRVSTPPTLQDLRPRCRPMQRIPRGGCPLFYYSPPFNYSGGPPYYSMGRPDYLKRGPTIVQRWLDRTAGPTIYKVGSRFVLYHSGPPPPGGL